MERAGLVRRVSDLDKKNLAKVELAEKGREIYEQSETEEPVYKIMASLSMEEHWQLRLLLKKLWDKALEELGMEKWGPSKGENTDGG